MSVYRFVWIWFEELFYIDVRLAWHDSDYSKLAEGSSPDGFDSTIVIQDDSKITTKIQCL